MKNGMILKKYFTLLLLVIPTTMMAQKQTATVGSKVKQIAIRDSNDQSIPLPGFGEKHLLIFYPDPDHASQNKSFTDYLEEHPINSDNIMAYGIVNLKDAPMMPNSIVRAIIRNKVKKTGANIYTDPEHLLRDGWGLGDVNNLFTILFVTKEGEIAFLHKGEMSKKDIEEFFRVINQYK